MSEEVKPVIEGVSTESQAPEPAAPTPPAPPESQHRHGMHPMQAQQFFNLCYLGLERMSQRQRTMFRRAVKAASRDLNARWPNGRPMDDVDKEVKSVAPQIIIPEGVNADALKGEGK